MYKYLLIPVIVVSLFSCNQNPAAKSTHKSLADSLHAADTGLKVLKPEQLIVPGKRIGNIYINGNADSLIAVLGKPNFEDAATRPQLMKWMVKYNKKEYITSVYSQRNMKGVDETVSHIDAIKVTSPWYKTADYAGVGSELKDIKKLYKLSAYPCSVDSKTLFYEAEGQGVTFEIDSKGKCLSVYIHAPNDSTGTYLDIH